MLQPDIFTREGKKSLQGARARQDARAIEVLKVNKYQNSKCQTSLKWWGETRGELGHETTSDHNVQKSKVERNK